MGCKNGNDERLVEQLHDLIDTNIMTLQALERCTHIGSWLCCNALAILGQIGEHRKQHEAPHESDGVIQTKGIQPRRSEEHTSELQSLMRISYAVFCLKKKKDKTYNNTSFQ